MSNTIRLLDISVVIKHFRQGGGYTARLEACDELFLPNTALAELYAGAYRSARQDKNLAQIDRFVQGVTLILADEQTARLYGKISAHLAAQGAPIPQNDIWIAATAMQRDFTLATADQHFSRVTGLNTDVW